MNQYAKDLGYRNDMQEKASVYASQLGGLVSPGEIAKREAEIPHQLDRLERTLKGCVQGLESLGARLEGSVMRGEAQKSGINEAAAPPASTQVGSRLQDLTSVAALVNDRIQSITARLEV